MKGLFNKRVDTLYRTDANGRLQSPNGQGARQQPRFHLMRTSEGPIFRCRADLPNEIVRRLGELCSQEPLERAAEKLPLNYDRYLELLADHAPIEEIGSGPAFISLRDVLPNRTSIRIDEGNAELLRHCFEDWLTDVPHAQPFMALIEGGRAVSICASVRISEVVHCAGVETHLDHRRRGYACDVVAGWAQAVRSRGAVPFYSTSWDNTASRRIAGRLGFLLAGVDFHVS